MYAPIVPQAHFHSPIVDTDDRAGRADTVWQPRDGLRGALHALLRKLRPARLVDVGSGFSSLLIADVMERLFFDTGECEFVCIEPYPRAFLTRAVGGVSRPVQERVENVDLAELRVRRACARICGGGRTRAY